VLSDIVKRRSIRVLLGAKASNGSTLLVKRNLRVSNVKALPAMQIADDGFADDALSARLTARCWNDLEASWSF
jgi:hypothetical protein